MPILRIQSIPLRPVFEQDAWGGIVEREKTRTFPFEVACDLELPRRQLSFNVIISVPKTMAERESDAAHRAIAWLVLELPRLLASRGYWDFFGYTRLTVDSPAEMAEGSTLCVERNVTISERIADLASAACDDLERIESKFEEAKQRLSDLASNNFALGFAQTLGEARGLFRTIEAVLGAGASLGGYTGGDARSALRDYEELARRKVESNHNYQSALTSLQSFAFGVQMPGTWGTRPSV